MKRSKRFLSAVLVICMVLSMLPSLGLTASAAAVYTATPITTTDDIVAGGMYIFVENNNALIGAISNSALQSVASFNLTGLSGSEDYVWTLEASGTDGQYYIRSSAGKYLTNSLASAGEGSTSLSFSDTNSSIWSFSYSDSDLWLIQRKSDDNNNGRFLGRTSNTSTTYKAYASGNLDKYPHAFTIYKLSEVVIAEGDVVATLVTSADELFAGGHYLLVAYDTTDSNLYASTLVSTASNATEKRNLPSVSVGTGAPPQTLTIPQATAEKVYKFQLEDAGGTWKFSATNGDGYLYKGTSNDSETQNVLRLSNYAYSTTTTMADRSDEWNISFYEEKIGDAVTAPAQIDNVLYPTYHIRLNHNADNNGKPIFSSYTTAHNPVYLYRLTYSATECPVTVDIRCGEGQVYILKDNVVVASSNVAGNEGRGFVSGGDEVTLVMKPATGYKLSALERGGSRITEWTWNETYGAYTYTRKIEATETGSQNYFNISFLPRRAGTGITAVQATEITDGYYVITGISAAPENNQHDGSSTYLLYGDDSLAIGDNIGRKSGAVLLNDLGITLDNTTPYTMNGLSIHSLYYFEKVEGTEYYTIRMCGATTDKYLACTSAKTLKTVDAATEESGAYWTVKVVSTTGATTIENAKYDTSSTPNKHFTLQFNGASSNLQFRAYADLTAAGLYTPILYKADVNGYSVTYSKTGGGTVTAYNETKNNDVVSGSVQAKDSYIRFTFTPSEGYALARVTVNGKEVTPTLSGNSYIYAYTKLDQQIEVVAEFTEIVYNNAITVNYYVNSETTPRLTLTPTVEDKYYYVDLSQSVTVNETSHTYAYLTFSKAVNGGAEYTSASDPILISNGDTIDLYFLTTAVKLQKTASETTAADTSLTGMPNGGTTNGSIGAFSGTENNKDEYDNVKQTFEVNLHVESSDMIPGYTEAKPTDIILVLDDSNSMFPNTTDGRTINNAKITKEAINAFLDVAINDVNRVAVVQYNSYASAWDGTEFVGFVDFYMSSYPTLTEANCFMSRRKDVDTAVTAALTQDEDNGATNTMGGYIMAQAVAYTRSAESAASRNLIIIMFTDGKPTCRYGYNSTTQQYVWTADEDEGYARDTSSYEFNNALTYGQQLRTVDATKNASIYAVALLGGEDYTDADRTLAEYLMGKTPKKYTGSSSTNILNYVSSSSYWEDSTSYVDAYFPVTSNDATTVTNEMVDIFKQIAYTTVADSYITGTLTDTIPANFKLTMASETKLTGAGWAVTHNADGTTTITKDGVVADKTGTNLTYEIEYQGLGVGSVFTNTSASFTYTDILTGTETTGNFAKPAVSVVAWTVDDELPAEIGVDRSINVTNNDLFNSLTEGGYIIVDYKIRLTDSNGADKTYYDAVNPQTGDKFDAFVDENSQTVSFYTLTPDTHTFYYVVEATVRAPDGTETTVYSRATTVVVKVTDLPTVNDADVVKAGEEKTINVLWNDTLKDGEGVTTKVTITDASGNPFTPPDGLVINVNADGKITYTTPEGDGSDHVYEFYYKVEQTSGEVTFASQPTKVTVYSVESQYIVVDFGLATQDRQYRASSNVCIADDITLDSELSVSTLALRKNETEYGTMTSVGNVYSFTPNTTNFNGVSVYEYTVAMSANAYNQSADNVSATVTVIPANNVYYEENFISFTDGHGWMDEGTAHTDRDQDQNNAFLHGYDPAYDADIETDTYSNGNEKSVTVSASMKAANGYFTFTGTGFDLYSECGPNSGVIVAEVYEGEITEGAKPVKVILVDTYLANATYYQIPVVMCRDLAYKTYTVKLRAFYNAIFDHNYPAKTAVWDGRVRTLLGLDADTELICLNMQSVDLSGAKTAAAPPAVTGQYNVYVDAVRIYDPLGTLTEASGIAHTAYAAANEENPVFVNINDTVIDAANTTGWANKTAGVTGILYLATGGESASAQDVFDDQTVVCLGAAGTIKTVTDNGKDYLLDKDGKRITYEGADVYVQDVSDPNSSAGKAFFYDKDGSPVQLNRGQLSTLDIYCYENKYDAIGPENEVYLKNDQGLAFKVPENVNIQISAKVPYGSPVTLMAYTTHEVTGLNEDTATAGWHTVEAVSTRTELYYDLTPYVNSDQTLILKCVTGDANAVLSLCNIKGVGSAVTTNGAEPLMTVDSHTLMAAMNAFYPVAHTHSYTVTVTEPTCTEQGYTTHTCDCNETFVDSYVNALGHDWDDGVVTLAPTATEAGVKTYSCSRCSETYTEALAPLGEPCDGGEACPSAVFTDVSANDWYHLSIDFVAEHDLMGGIGDSLFDPEGTMNRAMLVTVLWRCEGKPTGAKNPFSDVPAGEWYTDAVAWAAENGIVNGVGDGKFDPTGNVTREQIAVILCRYTEVCGIADTSKRGDLRGYPDAKDTSEYATDALSWAVGEELILGSEGKLLPQGDATRAQVATILMRYLENIAK